jgi:hypothetical protein
MHRKLLMPLAWMIFTVTLSLCAKTYEVAQRNPQASDDGDGSRDRP